jgi:hypothetical protein
MIASRTYTGRPALMPVQEQRLALVGAALALVLLALLVSVLNDNVAQAQSKQQVAEAKMQERGRCNALQSRRAREQCLLELRLGDEASAQIAQR